MVIYLNRTFCVSENCSCGQKLTDELINQIKNNEIDMFVVLEKDELFDKYITDCKITFNSNGHKVKLEDVTLTAAHRIKTFKNHLTIKSLLSQQKNGLSISSQKINKYDNFHQ